MAIKFPFYEERNNDLLGTHQDRLFTISLFGCVFASIMFCYLVYAFFLMFNSLCFEIVKYYDLCVRVYVYVFMNFGLFGRDINIRLVLRDNLRMLCI